MNNPILTFLQELVVRLRSKSPKFFRILQGISIATALVAGLPAFLEYLGITLPDFLVAIENKAIGIAALVSAFITGLPVDKKVDDTLKTNTETNTEVVVQKDIDLPFTDKFDK